MRFVMLRWFYFCTCEFHIMTMLALLRPIYQDKQLATLPVHQCPWSGSQGWDWLISSVFNSPWVSSLLHFMLSGKPLEAICVTVHRHSHLFLLAPEVPPLLWCPVAPGNNQRQERKREDLSAWCHGSMSTCLTQCHRSDTVRMKAEKDVFTADILWDFAFMHKLLTHTDTCINNHNHTHTDTQTDRQTHTHTNQAPLHTYTHTHTHTHTQAPLHTHIHTYTHTHTQIHFL